MLGDTPTVDQRRPCAVLAVDDDAGHGLGAALGDADLEIDQPHIVDQRLIGAEILGQRLATAR